MNRGKVYKHLIETNFMNISDKINKFRKNKFKKAVTTANKYK